MKNNKISENDIKAKLKDKYTQLDNYYRTLSNLNIQCLENFEILSSLRFRFCLWFNDLFSLLNKFNVAYVNEKINEKNFVEGFNEFYKVFLQNYELLVVNDLNDKDTIDQIYSLRELFNLLLDLKKISYLFSASKNEIIKLKDFKVKKSNVFSLISDLFDNKLSKDEFIEQMSKFKCGVKTCYAIMLGDIITIEKQKMIEYSVIKSRYYDNKIIFELLNPKCVKLHPKFKKLQSFYIFTLENAKKMNFKLNDNICCITSLVSSIKNDVNELHKCISEDIRTLFSEYENSILLLKSLYLQIVDLNNKRRVQNEMHIHDYSSTFDYFRVEGDLIKEENVIEMNFEHILNSINQSIKQTKQRNDYIKEIIEQIDLRIQRLDQIKFKSTENIEIEAPCDKLKVYEYINNFINSINKIDFDIVSSTFSRTFNTMLDENFLYNKYRNESIIDWYKHILQKLQMHIDDTDQDIKNTKNQIICLREETDNFEQMLNHVQAYQPACEQCVLYRKYSIKCGHTFCSTCMANILDNKRCFYCNCEVDKSDVLEICW